MSVEASNRETRNFQAEVKQILRLVINSLYSNKDIFLRELISNASDACDKLRFAALTDDRLLGNDSELCIHLQWDSEARTLTIRDNGIGMSRDEVNENIGTIAHSGTRQFLDSLSGDQASAAHLIGQFGVGFYSSFIVADRVTLTTRRAGLGADEGVRWESDGTGEYTLETLPRAERGTEVTLHLRDEDAEYYLNEWRLREIITRYSDHIDFPVKLTIERPLEGENEGTEVKIETVNRASALWTRPRNDISDDEYREFYRHLAHDSGDPLLWSHNRVEGRQEYTSLLYVPSSAPFDLWDRDKRRGIKLYVQRVFIMDDAEELMPRYLRFVRGVIDSADLPLNVSRELLQNNRLVEQIRNGSVKKVLGMLEQLAEKEPDRYHEFWQQFGQVLKEGPGEDFSNREQIARLLRFASTRNEDAEQNVSLANYIAAMKDEQKAIYYITADTHSAARNSPHLEAMRRHGIEVLLLSDRVDEWLANSLNEFDGKPLRSVAKGQVDLSELGIEDEAKTDEDTPKTDDMPKAAVLERLRAALKEQVQDVRTSKRLVESPACLVVDEHALSPHLERLLRDAGQAIPGNKPYLEVNTEHALLHRLENEQDEQRFNDLARVLFDQALLAEGGQLEDPATFVRRINQLLA